MKVYVPHDASSLSLGADEVAEAFSRQDGVDVVRNGSRGLYWLEPMVEIETPQGRHAYGPVAAADAAAIIKQSVSHPLFLGPVEEIPALKIQNRLTFARCGVIEALSLDDYKSHGGFAGLEKALKLAPQQIVDAVKASGLRGRGGAAFPAGIKWQTVLTCVADKKYIVCNADEGDSGTFADRMIIEGDPFCLIEGMIIAGLAVGATQGYVYLRSEYPNARGILQQAIDTAYASHYLGSNLCGSGKGFDLEIRVGAGAYICGEETALLESLEGKRGMIRYKPPLPAIKGLFGRPTVVNNVITLTTVPFILANGAEAYSNHGAGKSRGTLTVQLAGNAKRPGLYELDFGIPLRKLLYDIGGGTATGRPIKAVQCGGPLGAYLHESQFDLPLTYEDLATEKAMVGHGGVVVFDDTVNMAEQARYAMEFCAVESCGKCTPCRVGSVRGEEVIKKIIRGENVAENRVLLEDLCETMIDGSLCAMGGMTPFPVLSALQFWPEDFGLAPARKAA
ncbi:MAG: formate dehydrogenase beta subunit [Alphaproteobacteria bacterium]|nr:MAG: formate dehydrogenase beta subunit [Alphaproteobacteria bacterium]